MCDSELPDGAWSLSPLVYESKRTSAASAAEPIA